MTQVNYEWVKEQLTTALVQQEQGDAVLLLLKAWETVPVSDPAITEEILDIFSTLAQGHAINEATERDEVWIQMVAGQITVGDDVRVRHDAFDGPDGAVHNGRRGKVVGVRYGKVIVRTTDGRDPALDGAHYSPQHLEKRILK